MYSLGSKQTGKTGETYTRIKRDSARQQQTDRAMAVRDKQQRTPTNINGHQRTARASTESAASTALAASTDIDGH